MYTITYYNDIVVKYYTAAVTNPMAAAPRRIMGTSRIHITLSLHCVAHSNSILGLYNV